jgi:hypothetical protein
MTRRAVQVRCSTAATAARVLAALLALPAAGLASRASAHDGDATGLQWTPGSDARRGQFTLAAQLLHTGSLILDDGTIPGRTETDTQAVRMGIDWKLDPRWELHASVPFIMKKSNGGPGAPLLAPLDVPHPAPTFHDDARYHSGWQDWSLGVSYHSAWRGFLVESRATLGTPTHDYSFYGNAAAGQNLTRLDLGIDLTRQPLGSNFYYGFGYSYVVIEEVLGVNMNKNHWRVQGGWFANDRLSFRAFANGSLGKGRDSSDFIGDRHSEDWYHHDQTSRHNYAIAGVGAWWHLNADYSVGLNAATMVWGRTVHDLKRAYEVQLVRNF